MIQKKAEAEATAKEEAIEQKFFAQQAETPEPAPAPAPEPQPEPPVPPEGSREYQTSSTTTATLTPEQFRRLKVH
jgi:hypothetical protein